MSKIEPYMEDLLSGIIYVYPYNDKDGNFHKKDVDTKDDTPVDKKDRNKMMELAADDLINIAYAQKDLSLATPIVYEIARFVTSIKPSDGRLFTETHERLKNALVHTQRTENVDVLKYISKILFKQTRLIFEAKDYPSYFADVEFYKSELYRIYSLHTLGKTVEIYKDTIEKAFSEEAKGFDYVRMNMKDGPYRTMGLLCEENMDTMSYATIPYFYERKFCKNADENTLLLYEDIAGQFREEMELLDCFNKFISNCPFDKREEILSADSDYFNLARKALGYDSQANFPALTALLGETAHDTEIIEDALSEYPPCYHTEHEPEDMPIVLHLEKRTKDIRYANKVARAVKVAKRTGIGIVIVFIALIVIKILKFDSEHGTMWIVGLPLIIYYIYLFIDSHFIHPPKVTRISHYNVYGWYTGYSEIIEDGSVQRKHKVR